MGKGDKKTRRGKIYRGSYGRLRPRKETTISLASKPKAKAKTTTKAKSTAKEEESA
ncbi:30S ribosomal protein THX [Aquimarina sp. 2201CG5-10]|uniref:30S ribosomal protein THX n=1 Tax=Aquimarina callyspongiae TaxID=3098150 RepID=UPI002AB5D087|nr:30S ribosomal protein THX [Aquimarina sp. 2201CG5-10]MDY8134195.1 30S ribosomal protein THX [Aquimarina sp. 2201CG5-10]